MTLKNVHEKFFKNTLFITIIHQVLFDIDFPLFFLSSYSIVKV